MRLLDRYLLRELMVPLIITLSGFLLLWLVSDLISNISGYQQRGLQLHDVAELYFYKTSKILSEGLVPLGLLLSTMYALANHARHNEITAIRAAGIGTWRLLAPYLLVGTFFSLGLFWINEYALRDADLQVERIKRRYEEGGPAEGGAVIQDFNFYNERDKRKWTIAVFDRSAASMTNLLVEWDRPDGRLQFVNADSAQWVDGEWVFRNALVRVLDSADREKVAEFSPPQEQLVIAEFREDPEQVWSEFTVSQINASTASKRAVVSLETLNDYFALHPELGGERRALLLTQFHSRIATPWTCLVVMLLAIPFAAPSGRRNVFFGVTAGLALCFLFFVLQRICLGMGTGGRIPPWLAAWLPNLLFATLGITLISRVR